MSTVSETALVNSTADQYSGHSIEPVMFTSSIEPTIINTTSSSSSSMAMSNLTSQSTVMNDSVANATAAAMTYSGQLMAFSQWYQTIHGYVCVFVCLFGIAANIMNIIVLTRRNMVCCHPPPLQLQLLYYFSTTVTRLFLISAFTRDSP